MFKLISLAMHFSPYNQSPLDPTVFEMLRRELGRKPLKADNVVELTHTREGTEIRKAA